MNMTNDSRRPTPTPGAGSTEHPAFINVAGLMPVAALSHVVAHGQMVFVSGVLGTDAAGTLIGDTVEEQTARAFANLRLALAAVEADLINVVQVRVYLADCADLAEMNHAYVSTFGEHRPARTTVGGQLALGAKIEIDCIAIR